MKELKRMTPVWFRRNPTSEESTPNAIFCHHLGEVNGERVCEIEYHSTKWIVRESEIMQTGDALKQLAQDLHQKIKAAKACLKSNSVKETKKAIAASLNICPSTLNKRIAFLSQYLP